MAETGFESDFELEEEPDHIKPYLFELEELHKQWEPDKHWEEESPQTPITEDTWCTCGRCIPMSEDECLCCREWDLAKATLLELETTTKGDR